MSHDLLKQCLCVGRWLIAVQREHIFHRDAAADDTPHLLTPRIRLLAGTLLDDRDEMLIALDLGELVHA